MAASFRRITRMARVKDNREVLPHGRLVHESSHSAMCQHHAVKLLLDEFWSLAPQNNPTAAHVGFELIQSHFDLPAFRIERSQLLGGVLFAIRQVGDQSVERFRALNTFESIFNDSHDESVALFAFVLLGGIDRERQEPSGRTSPVDTAMNSPRAIT